MWLCTNWLIDWNAISAIATMVATLVALFFGLREVFTRLKSQRNKKVYMAVSVFHSVQLIINRCDAVKELLSDSNNIQINRIQELGEAIIIIGLPTLLKHDANAVLFGKSFASKYVYAISLIDEINMAGKWLSTPGNVTIASFEVAKECLDFIKESAEQSAKALSEIEPIIKLSVPAEIMELRFGPLN